MDTEPDGSEPFSDLAARHSNLEPLLDVHLPVIAILAEKELPLSQILSLDIGSVIVFAKHDSAPISLHVNNVEVGSGKTIKVGDHFGIHLRSYCRDSVVESLE